MSCATLAATNPHITLSNAGGVSKQTDGISRHPVMGDGSPGTFSMCDTRGLSRRDLHRRCCLPAIMGPCGRDGDQVLAKLHNHSRIYILDEMLSFSSGKAICIHASCLTSPHFVAVAVGHCVICVASFPRRRCLVQISHGSQPAGDTQCDRCPTKKTTRPQALPKP